MLQALLQLATTKTVFLLDLISLHWQQWDPVLSTLFRASLVKVGFGWNGDVERLHKSFPKAACFQQMAPVADLSRVCLAGVRKGLSALVQVVLGLPLDKSAQASDWAQRPLSSVQVALTSNLIHCSTPTYIASPYHSQYVNSFHEPALNNLSGFTPSTRICSPKHSCKSN